MAKEEWGTKRICPETGKRFYDLNNNPVISPYTGKAIMLDKPSSEKVKSKMKSAEIKKDEKFEESDELLNICLLYTSPSPRDLSTSRMPSSA